MKEFPVAASELQRRETAFTRLSISWLASSLLGLLLWLEDPMFIGFYIFILALILLISRLLLSHFFGVYKQARLIAHSDFLERITSQHKEKYPLNEISSIKTIFTSHALIRELRINFRNSKSLSLNALENISQLRKWLLDKTGKGVKQSEAKEPVDYDHPLFYIFLGGLIGFTSAWVVAAVLKATQADLRIIYSLIALFSVALAVYFAVSQPLARHYGKRERLADLVISLLMAASGVLVYLMGNT